MTAFSSTMQYTIGTALSRALDAGHDVEVLVEGQWLGGRVVASDGVGLVLEASQTEHSVVRMDSINAVRVLAGMPNRPRLRAARLDDRLDDGSRPMPGPRVSVE